MINNLSLSNSKISITQSSPIIYYGSKLVTSPLTVDVGFGSPTFQGLQILNENVIIERKYNSNYFYPVGNLLYTKMGLLVRITASYSGRVTVGSGAPMFASLNTANELTVCNSVVNGINMTTSVTHHKGSCDVFINPNSTITLGFYNASLLNAVFQDDATGLIRNYSTFSITLLGYVLS